MFGRKSNFINGDWVEGEGEIININPSDTNDIIDKNSNATSNQLSDAIKAAQIAQRKWEDVGIEKRANILHNIGSELINQSKEIGTLLSREEGKTLPEGIGEVVRSGQQFQYYAASALRQFGENIASTRDGVSVELTREPIGVCGIISPWNFPIAIAAWKAAPAMAFGNAIVLKPASQTPASAIALTKIISEQKDIPEGLFNLVLGGGGTIGHQISEHKNINAISFTGSVNVGQTIYKEAAKTMKKMQLEMGSKNPLLIMDDADLEIAVTCAANGAYGGTGQKCTASSRLIVHEKVYNEFIERLIKSISGLKVGHALKEGSQMGPVSSESQLKSNLDYVEKGKNEAKLAYGGNLINLDTPGYFMEPTLFIDGDNKSTINQEEMFGPIACVIPVKSYEEGLEVANDTIFGLSSGIITQSLSMAADFKKNIKTGVTTVNLPTAGLDYHVPFGGRKASSFGPREQGTYAHEFFTQVKTTYVNPGKIK